MPRAPWPTRWVLFLLPLVSALAVAVLLSTVSGTASAQTEPPAHGDWEVSDSTTITDRTVLLDGNLTVTHSGRLTLENATIVINNTYPGRYMIIVGNGAHLTMRDLDGDPSTEEDASVILSAKPHAQYRWICEEGSRLRIQGSVVRHCGHGWGLVVATDDAIISNSTITGGFIGVAVKGGSVDISDCNVSGHWAQGITVENGTARIDRCLISNNLDIGVLVHSPMGTTQVRNCTIENHVMSGVDVRNGTAMVADCTISNTSWTGIRFNNKTAGWAVWNTIHHADAYGIQIEPGCRVLVTNSTVHDVGDSGIVIRNATAWVLDSHIWGCANDSIYMYDSPSLVQGNLLEGNGQTGIVVFDSLLFMLYENTIRDNGVNGIAIGTQGLHESIGWVQYNTIHNNRRTGIFVGSNTTCILGRTDLRDNGWYGIYCAEDGTLEWTTRGTSTVTNESLLLRGEVVVRRNTQLLLSNTTVAFGLWGVGWNQVVVRGGDLRMSNGSSMMLTSEQPGQGHRGACIQVSEDGRMNASDSEFDEVCLVVHDGALEANRCTFTHLDRAVSTVPRDASVELRNCSFSDGGQGVVAEGADVLIDDCSFLRMVEGVNMTDCNGPGPKVLSTSFFSVTRGLVLEGSVNVHVDDCSFKICHDSVVATDVMGLIVTGTTVDKGTGHGVRSWGSDLRFNDTVVSECAAGGVVVDGGELRLEECTLSRNGRVGVWANGTELRMVNTSVTGTEGIGVWNGYSPAAQPHDDFLMRGCFLQGSDAYDLRLEGTFLARVYNTNLDPDAARVLDNVVLEVYNPWVLKVVVEGVEPVPPGGSWFELIDQFGKVQGVEDIPAGENVVQSEGKAYTMTADERTVHTPYTVTVNVAGREWAGDVVLGFGVVSTIHVELDLEPEVTFEALPVEGLETTLTAGGTAYPFGAMEWNWSVEGLDTGPLSGENATVTFPTDGEYGVTLRVEDKVGNARTITSRITVGDAVPEATIVTEVPDELDEDQVLQLVGRYVTVVDDVIIQEWDFGDGTKASGASVEHSWSEAGAFNLTFTVVDVDGSHSVDRRVINVENVIPVAVIRLSDVEVGKGERFDLDGSLSWDTPSDNGSLRYMWDMGGDPFLTGAQSFWRMYEVGEYTIRLMVVDDDGDWDRTSMTVTVFNRPPAIGSVPDALLNATDDVWSHRLEVSDPDDEVANLTLSYPEFEPGGAFTSWVERDDDGGWTLYVRPREERDGSRAGVQVTVRDPDGGEASTTFRIEIDTSMVEEGSLPWWLVAAVALVLVVLTVGFYALTRRQVPPPQPPDDADDAEDVDDT